MSTLPKILVQINKKQEVPLFLKFLNHPEFPGHRTMILQVFPNLKEFLENSNSEKQAVVRFINQFYSEHNIDISLAIEESTEEMKDSPKALQALSEAMDYHWHDNITYIAEPTILPFSPFNNNTFYFSILGRIMKKEKKNVLIVAIHEISHFVFFEMLKKIEGTEKVSLPTDIKHYLKESLTAAIFNEEPLRSTLKIDNSYLGNPEIRDIYVKDLTGPAKTITEYIRGKYAENKENSGNFMGFLKDIILLFNETSEEFSKKRQMWNRWEKELFKNQSAFDDYRQPIELKRPRV